MFIYKHGSFIFQELDQVENLHTLEEIGSISLASIRIKLLSTSFQVAILSVLSSVPLTTSKTPDLQTLQQSLESIAKKLQFVQSIYTRFWLLTKSQDITRSSKDSIIPEWESGSRSSHRSLYYVDRSNTRLLIADPPSYISVLDLVSIVVSHVLRSPVPLPIASLFLSPEGSETALVNILKLSSDVRVTGGVGGFF